MAVVAGVGTAVFEALGLNGRMLASSWVVDTFWEDGGRKDLRRGHIRLGHYILVSSAWMGP